MMIETRCGGWEIMSASVVTAFAAHPDTVVKPSGGTVLDLGRGVSDPPSIVPNNLLLSPYGTDADNETFDFRVWGWAPMFGGAPTLDKRIQWHAVLLGGFSVTLSSTDKGVSGGVLSDSIFYADTITLKTNEGTTGTSNEIISPTGDLGAHICLDIKGFHVIEFEFDMILAASGGVLVKPY